MHKRLFGLALLALSLSFAACGDDEPQNPQGDAGQQTDGSVPGNDGGACTSPCGLGCCTQDQVCVDATYCCTPACDGKQCGSNSCGGECGQCGDGETCDEAGQCVAGCVNESNEAFCERLEKNCGPVTAEDNCGEVRSWNCGICPEGETCNLQTNTCSGCAPEDQNAFCYRMGKQCGPATGEDNCGDERTVEECGPCSPGLQCDSLGQCGECTPEDEAAFCQRLGKDCGEVTELDQCRLMRTIDCGACDGINEVCTDNVCILPGAPANDNCLGAELLDTSTGQATVTADTTNAGDSGHGTCGGSNAIPDVVYQLHLDDVTNVEVVLTPPAGVDPVLYVRRVCDSTDSAESLGCEDDGGGDDPETLSLEMLPAGDYFVWVDGYSSDDVGAYTLSVSLSTPPPTPTNDQCGGAVALGFANDLATQNGTTLGAMNDVASSTSCGALTGGDVVYSFEITGSDRSVTVTATPDAASTTFRPAIVVLSGDCATGAEAICGKAASTGGAATASAYSLPPGTYYVIVDGVSGTTGGFDLSVQLGAAMTAPEDCSSAMPLTFTNGTATASGDTSGAVDSGHGTCGNDNGGKDLVYSFTIDPADAPMDLSATLTTSWDAVLYLTDACPATGNLSCSDPGTITARRLAAGTYYLWVDAYGTGSGSFTLTANLTASQPPAGPGDACTNPEPIQLTDGHAVITGTTASNALDDGRGSCSSGSATAPDLIYALNVSAPSQLHAVLTTSWDAVLFLTQACPGSSIACSDPGTVDTRLQPGTYYLWVDGWSSASGSFSLDVTLTELPPAPGNDTCSAPEPLVVGANGIATAHGDTTMAMDDYTGSCAGTGTDALTGGDMVYQLVLGSDSSVSAIVQARGSFKPAVYLRSADCASGTEVGCNRTSISGAQAVLDLMSVPAGTYYLVVDGANGQGGPFDLTVVLGTPRVLPDDCASAQVLDVSSGRAFVTGSTTNATQTGNSTCATSTYQDVVYTFTTTGTKNFQAKVQFTSSSYGPNLYLRKTACDSTAATDELACAKLVSGGSLSISASDLPAGTYWLWVDHPYSGEKGPFSLDVVLTDPLPNDGCSMPEPIVLAFDSANQVNIGSAYGDTTGAFNSGEGSCGGQSADLVYELTLQTEQTVEIELLPDPGSALNPILYLRSPTCGVSTEEVPDSCASASVGNPATKYFPRLAAGTYYVWVDGTQSTKGPFSLNVTTRDPPSVPANDVCDGTVLDLSSGSATVIEETFFATGDSTGTCANANGADLVYQVTTAQPGKLTVAVAPDSAISATFKPVVYVRDACGSAADEDEVTCASAAAGATATAVVNALQAGTYYVYVDGADGTFGRFTLTATLAAVATGPANESCNAPEVIVVDTSAGLPASATVTGTTTGAVNEATGSCSVSSAGDVVYSLTTLAAHKITATLTPASGSSLDPALYIRSSCGNSVASNQLVCNDANPSVAVVKNAQPGTYYLWVDGDAASTAGDFSLQVTLDNPILPPANDTCDTAIALQAGAAAVSGDTSEATDNYGTVQSQFTVDCDGPLYANNGGQVGPDLVYSFTPTLTGTFTVTVEDDFDSALWVTPVCSATSGTMEGACLDASDDGSEEVTIEGTTGTTYYIVVDGYSTSAKGTFTITVDEQ